MSSIAALLVALVAAVAAAQAASRAGEWCLSGIVAFGGSLTDTGNSVKLRPGFYDQGNPPYGITFPGFPSGRCSDGKLVLDFFGDALGMSSEQQHYPVANFAYAGACAANLTYRSSVYLLRQIALFQEQISPPLPYREFLFWIEIGRNDIQEELQYGNSTIEQIQRLSIPLAISSIRTALRALYSFGARKFLVQSNTPLGCSPLVKVLYSSESPRDYDSNKCLLRYNELAVLFNQHLRRTMRALERELPDAGFIYADAYTPLLRILENAPRFGFRNVEDACCGSGGQYNFRLSSKCGRGGKACSKPDEYVFWDGQHFTQQYYSVLATMYLSGQHLHPPVRFASCSSAQMDSIALRRRSCCSARRSFVRGLTLDSRSAPFETKCQDPRTLMEYAKIPTTR